MNWTFTGRHWTFTLLCGPIIFAVINGFDTNWSSNNYFDFFQLYPFMIFIGFLFSLPTYVFYILLLTHFKHKKIKMLNEKIALIIIVMIGVFITTALINGTVWLDLAISYSISSIITGLFFTQYFKDETES
ncbi:hypothetical protein IRZ71_15295 [Flavobacterium sp. ANB]|uniref:hypothetical protein n=1 Tax=unclassified Flavobacterium TaxID=196869 RepID=UPI0012B80DDB|nr:MULTISPECIES: hypothetical protein [unclassified Flavobacterium]MBF4517729.1 hypothetical protein [Flavobacterium sp. ANB]MTD70456.1 hypothetical protein [Flavobacterium sp. LC2016-13]